MRYARRSVASKSLSLLEVIVATTVTPIAATEKYIDWCEHVTLGDPFLDGARIQADVGRAWNWLESCGLALSADLAFRAGDLADWPGTRFQEPMQEVDADVAIQFPTSRCVVLMMSHKSALIVDVATLFPGQSLSLAR